MYKYSMGHSLINSKLLVKIIDNQIGINGYVQNKNVLAVVKASIMYFECKNAARCLFQHAC